MAGDASNELNAVLAHYDLGRLVDWQPDRRGTCNVSFVIQTEREGRHTRYFLRRYKDSTRAEEIRFEHSLIRHLLERGTCPVARLHATRAGQTYLRLENDEGAVRFYAVFDFLPGEDRYTWVGPRCTRSELRQAGAVLAEFHRVANSLVPEGQRQEPKILELLGVIERAWLEAPANSKGTVFDRELAASLEPMRRSIERTRTRLAKAAPGLPECFIHCDYHPGNLRFQGADICGVVDFDWSKRDLRAFDVALALWYFCVSWKGRADGWLRVQEASTFLRGYQAHLRSHAGLPPLATEEFRALPDLISAANIYVLYWALRDYFAKEVDPNEYLVYLCHSLAFARWFSSDVNRARLRAMLDRVRRG